MKYMFDLKVDIEARDKIIFSDGYVPEAYRRHGGSRSFEGVTLEQLQALQEQGFLDPEECQNDSPSIAEFMEYMKSHEGFTAHGYAISADREDYRVSIEGLQKLGDVTREDLIDFVNAFRWADELTCKDDELFCWYD